MRRDFFEAYHPITNFFYFMGAVITGMIFLHPVFTACLLVWGIIYYLYIKRSKGLKLLGWTAVMFAVLSLVNPFFNGSGRTVLFRYLGRRYTLEALIYGMVLAGMIAAVLLWFGCFNSVMTNDKFVYLFGRLAPSVSLVLSMIFRLVPEFRRKTKQITAARAAIGMAGDSSESRKEKIRNGTVILGTLTESALENSIVTADSMKARGYGTGKRTSFSIYRFGLRDGVFLAASCILLAFVIICACMGAAAAQFTPELEISWFGSAWTLWGHIAYAAFLLMPLAVNIKENTAWKISLARQKTGGK